MSDGQERYVFAATVTQDGRLKPDAVNATAGRLSKWKGRHVTVIVSRYVKSKTNPQLAMYFGPIIEAWSDFTGYTPDEMDTELRRAFLKPQLEVAKLTGEEISERPRIRDLNVEEMTVFIDRCLVEGRLLGIRFDEDINKLTVPDVDDSQAEEGANVRQVVTVSMADTRTAR